MRRTYLLVAIACGSPGTGTEDPTSVGPTAEVEVARPGCDPDRFEEYCAVLPVDESGWPWAAQVLRLSASSWADLARRLEGVRRVVVEGEDGVVVEMEVDAHGRLEEIAPEGWAFSIVWDDAGVVEWRRTAGHGWSRTTMRRAGEGCQKQFEDSVGDPILIECTAVAARFGGRDEPYARVERGARSFTVTRRTDTVEVETDAEGYLLRRTARIGDDSRNTMTIERSADAVSVRWRREGGALSSMEQWRWELGDDGLPTVVARQGGPFRFRYER